MAKNSHRPNGQRHQVSSLHSAALRVILVLEFICWEVASPSSAFVVPAMLLHRGTTSGFQAFGGYALGYAVKTAQTADTGATGWDWRFVCAISLCSQYNQHIFSLLRPRPAAASAGHSPVGARIELVGW